MKHIQTIILQMFFITLTMITLFTGCDTHFNPKSEAGGGGELAQVQVNIGGNARTILPDLDNGFSKFILSAESVGGSQNAPSPVEIDGSYWGYIYLPYGDWIITAKAYITIGGTDYAAAWGSAPLTIETSYHYCYLAVNVPEHGGTGTFNYTVRYPASGSASIKLEPWPLGSATLFNETAANGAQTVKSNVPSGVYFLTVTVTANSRTVVRNDIVHIYDKSPTNLDYVFTKLDFGDSTLNLSGTVKVLVNGVQPNYAYLWYSTDQNNWYNYNFYDPSFIFTWNNDGGTWSISLSNLGGATTLYFRVGLNNNIYNSIGKELQNIPVPVDDTAGIDLGTVEFNFNISSLPANTFVDGDIAIPYGEDWYSINVTAGTTYYFWWNDSYRGDGSKTMDVEVIAYTNNWDYIFGYDSAWTDPVSFTVDYGGTVYIRVNGWGNTGTYAIGYSTNGYWHNNTLNPVKAVPLSANTWRNGNITTPYAADLYSINVTAGTTYYFWWNCLDQGDDSKTLGIDVYAYTSNWDLIFDDYYAWSDPVSFTAYDSGTVYIRVRASSGNNYTGTYAVAYSTNKYWHNNSLNPANAVPLLANTWRNGNITTPYASDLYSINVTEGTTYYFWWNGSSRGDGSKTMDVEVIAYASNWDYIFGYASAWSDPVSFTASYSGMVYIRVRAHGGTNNTGTYAIGYSTNKYWHNNSLNPANAVPFPANTWRNGNITTPYASDLYSINVTEGTTYFFWWNDSNYGDGSKTLDEEVIAYTSNWDHIFGYSSHNAWSDPVSFTASYSGTVYIRVRSYGGYHYTGTYAIGYSTNGYWYNNSFSPPNSTQLAIDTWHDGEITTRYRADWYSINVSTGTTYYLWWNGGYNSGNSKTLPVEIYACGSAGNLIANSNYSWAYPLKFSAGYSDTVYIRVRAYGGNDSTGTYDIMYSDRPRINVGVEIRTAFEQNSYLYLNYSSEVNQGNHLFAEIRYEYWWSNNNPVVTYSWYIDGVPKNVNTEESSDYYSKWGTINLPTTGLSPGIHHGLAVVTIDGANFSRRFSFRVNQ